MKKVISGCIIVMMLALCLFICKESSSVSPVIQELKDGVFGIDTSTVSVQYADDIGAEDFGNSFGLGTRWKLILKGLSVSLVVSFCSSLFGTALGFLIILSLQSQRKWLSMAAKGFSYIMQGLPALVLLMFICLLLFVFPDSALVLMAIGIFSLMIAVSIVSVLQKSIASVDKGQIEASTVLGFGSIRTFTRIIMPQALHYALPLYKGEFLRTLKLIFLVGYISTQDHAKAWDIINTHKYEALFPLLMTAVIYLMVSYLIIMLAGRLKWRIDPEQRRRMLPDAVSGGDDIIQVKAAENSFQSDDRPALIEIGHLRKTYPGSVSLNDVNAVIRKGEVIAIIGPHGAGKSTLLRCINGLETPTEGRVKVFGHNLNDGKTDLQKIRRHIGMVFQRSNLFNHLTVIENVMLAPVVLKREKRKTAYVNAMGLLRKVGMADKAQKFPEELSSGQKQRAAIARALAMKPEIILFDGPDSALNPAVASELTYVINQLVSHGATIMIATHDLRFARGVASRILYMDEGIICEEGKPQDILENPKSDKTRAFVKHRSVLSLPVESAAYDFFAMSDSLQNFGRENKLSKKQMRNMQCIYEEVFALGIVLNGAPDFPFDLNVEYEEATDKLEIRLNWSGREYNPLENGDESSLKLVNEALSDSSFSYKAGENRLVILL